MTTERLTISVSETARLLGISRSTAYQAVERGEIPSIRVGRRILVPREALAGFLKNGRGTASLGGAGASDGTSS